MFLEKLSKKFSAVMNLTGLLPISEKPTIKAYPAPVESSQYPRTVLL
jgi:hypothetical protein